MAGASVGVYWLDACLWWRRFVVVINNPTCYDHTTNEYGVLV